jgi:hypothetical protein
MKWPNLLSAWHLGGTWTTACLLLCCLALACQPTTTPKATTIPDEKMARILADLNLAEAATARLNGYPKDSLRQVYFKQVMEIHGVTMADYEANLRVIVADQVRLEALLKASESLLEEKAGQ